MKNTLLTVMALALFALFALGTTVDTGRGPITMSADDDTFGASPYASRVVHNILLTSGTLGCTYQIKAHDTSGTVLWQRTLTAENPSPCDTVNFVTNHGVHLDTDDSTRSSFLLFLY